MLPEDIAGNKDGRGKGLSRGGSRGVRGGKNAEEFGLPDEPDVVDLFVILDDSCDSIGGG